MKDDTLAVVAGRDPDANFGVVNPPVYHASTIAFPTLAALEAAGRRPLDVPYYGRNGTPGTFAFEEAVAALEGGDRSVAVASGKAAVLTALTAFVEAGDHMLVADSAYGPTRAYCERFLKRFGVETTFYDPEIGAGIAGLIRPNTRLVFVESPGSLTFEVQDVPAIAEAARAAGCTVAMDNTWASPLFLKPFALGVDLSVQAATKYIGGHSDVMLGVVTATAAVQERARKAAFDLGAPAGPDDVYLAQRGLRTLAVRMPRHMESGLAVADWLRGRPQVARVLHPGLPGDPGPCAVAARLPRRQRPVRRRTGPRPAPRRRRAARRAGAVFDGLFVGRVRKPGDPPSTRRACARPPARAGRTPARCSACMSAWSTPPTSSPTSPPASRATTPRGAMEAPRDPPRRAPSPCASFWLRRPEQGRWCSPPPNCGSRAAASAIVSASNSPRRRRSMRAD